MSDAPPAHVHATCRLCRCTPAEALALLGTANGLARWNLGLWRTQAVAPGLCAGESLYDGSRGLVRIDVDAAAGRVRYAVGHDAGALVPRIEARVQAAVELGFAEGHCLVTLLAWRSAGMDDTRWQRLVAAHEAEIDLIRGQLESGSA